MARVFYLHWNEGELGERLEALRRAGHEADGWWEGRDGAKKLIAFHPEVVVISLDRVPSHGAAFADWFWEAKSRRGIPLVFLGGQPEQVKAIRERFPPAHFRSTEDLWDILDAVSPPE
jgi:hypothetical protein